MAANVSYMIVAKIWNVLECFGNKMVDGIKSEQKTRTRNGIKLEQNCGNNMDTSIL
jgi:hypothetical protein